MAKFAGLRICALAGVTLLLVACGSDPKTTPTAGTGTTSGTTAGVSIPQGPVPGSEQDFVVNVGDRVFFGFDESSLSSEARGTLDRQAEWLKRYPQVAITVEGNCDERGTRAYNLALSARRANSVKTYLVSQGIQSARITTISYGKERPVALCSNESCWSQNRNGISVITSGATS